MLTRQFEIIPAVDVLGKEAVRLERGAFDRVVARERNPLALVEHFSRAGASRIHMVDLDGARTGRLRPELVRALATKAAPARVQASGGVRSVADARALLAAGADRVVVGTAAFAQPDAIERFVGELGDRLVVAIDVREGRVVTGGWTLDTELTVDLAVDRCVAAGVRRLLSTAVDRDGTLGGPDLELLAHVVERSGVRVLAAGGVRSQADLDAVEQAGCEGAVVGRALIDGRLVLSILAEQVGMDGRSAGPSPLPRAGATLNGLRAP
jgi:phosphoribosylformimino-5-aminoimidazole carboxamide ribotide isomerase